MTKNETHTAASTEDTEEKLPITRTFVDELHDHFLRQDAMIRRITRGMIVGLVVIITLAIGTAIQVVLLIQSMNNQVALMKDEMHIVNGHMTSIHEYMVSMDKGIRVMSDHTAQVAMNMDEMSANMKTMAEDIHAIPDMRQDMAAMTQTMGLMRGDTAAMEEGLRNMVFDTRAISHPFRFMPFP